MYHKLPPPRVGIDRPFLFNYYVEYENKCRGPYCVFADEAVALLQQHGYRARRLTEGLPDWQALNLPVAMEGRVN